MNYLKLYSIFSYALVFEFAATVLAPKDWNNYLSLSMHESVTSHCSHLDNECES